MSTRLARRGALAALPDHTQLPDTDGKPVRNDLEPPQSTLLTESITPHLKRLHPDGRFWIAQDCGIYWRLTAPPEPAYEGAVAPDWYYVPGVWIKPDKGLFRRSFVLWKEKVLPLIAIEYASGDGREERDQTERVGKFWIYEQGIGIPYYAIYEVNYGQVEVYRLVRGRYRRMRPNERGHYPIKEMKAELGIWSGTYQDRTLPWLRWYDAEGNLLPTNEEQKDQALRQAEKDRSEREQALRQAEKDRSEREQALRQAEKDRRTAEDALRKAERLAKRLRELGINPEET
jgi:hypothetical protein